MSDGQMTSQESRALFTTYQRSARSLKLTVASVERVAICVRLALQDPDPKVDEPIATTVQRGIAEELHRIHDDLEALAVGLNSIMLTFNDDKCECPREEGSPSGGVPVASS